MQRSVELLDLARGRRGSAALMIGVVIYLVSQLARIHMSSWWPPTPSDDASIIFDHSIKVLRLANYPEGSTGFIFPYPPPAAVIFGSLAILGPTSFMLTWLALMIAGFFATLCAPFAGDRLANQRLWPLTGAIALAATESPVGWDLSSANCNLIYLGLVLLAFAFLRRRPVLAGALIGLSVSLKLYSCLLIVWLALHRPRWALFGALVSLLALWAALPVFVFGIHGAIQVYQGWLEQVRGVARLSAAIAISGRPIGALVTLRYAAEALLGANRPGAVQVAVLALQAAWIGLLLLYAWCSVVAGRSDAPSRAALADWTVLMLAPLPMSPWLEPYHLVPMISGAILCALLVLDRQAAARARKIALGLLACLVLSRVLSKFTGLPFTMRGFLVLGQAAALILALATLRPSLDRRPIPAVGIAPQGD